MKFSTVVLALSVLTLGSACKSELDNKTAAEVSETSAATTSETSSTSAATTATTSSPVIKDKSSIHWVGAKVTGDHKGEFKNFDGSIDYAAGKPSRIAFDIDVNSVVSDNEKLTGHLKSPDFFDVAKFPKATFVSTSIADAPAGTAGGATHIVKGTLDLHGVQKEVSFPVVSQVSAEGVRTKSEFTINRHDWGISYKGAADDLIKDSVLIRLDLLFPPPPAV